MNRLNSFFIFVIVALSFSAKADRVMLLDSTVYEGEVTKVSGCEVKLEITGVRTVFKAHNIAFVEFSDLDNRHYNLYIKKYASDEVSCFSFLKARKELSEKRIAMLVGPSFSLTGKEGAQYVDYFSGSLEDEEVVATYYAMRKANRKRNFRIALAVLSILNFISF